MTVCLSGRSTQRPCGTYKCSIRGEPTPAPASGLIKRVGMSPSSAAARKACRLSHAAFLFPCPPPPCPLFFGAQVSAGIKPTSIVSYNHLGNNDGRNLSAPSQFRSKEISKSNVVDDMVDSNKMLYSEGEHPDHVVSAPLVCCIKHAFTAA